MTTMYDSADTQDRAIREAALFARLGERFGALMVMPAWAARLSSATAPVDRAALARLPVLRKTELMALQAAHPPFGGLVPSMADVGRLFMSPGPVYEPEGAGTDPWGAARALYAAGFRGGDIVQNTFGYTLTPGGFILDSAARALGCPVIPAGPGNTETQLQLIRQFRPAGYTGTPDFLKILADGAAKAEVAFTITKALVSGAYLPPSLRAEMAGRGVSVRQAYATADLGVIAYESEALEGLIVNEGLLLEIVRPGTDDPVPDGEVGEVVVTRIGGAYPLVRFGTGDLSALMSGTSPCGRTAPRIKGWMGRADQRTKVKGMFVDPAQIDTVLKAHPGLGRARLVVSRADEQDTMLLKVEAPTPDPALAARLGDTLRDILKLKGAIELVGPGTLPNDGKVIDDTRPVG
jgi:phenylacetate-CoA ligase